MTFEIQLILCLCRYDPELGGGEYVTLLTAASIFNVSPQYAGAELFKGRWLKENLIQNITSFTDEYYLSSKNVEVALQGMSNLSYEQYHSIESALLQRLISEEPEFEKSAAGKIQAVLISSAPREDPVSLALKAAVDSDVKDDPTRSSGLGGPSRSDGSYFRIIEEETKRDLIALSLSRQSSLDEKPVDGVEMKGGSLEEVKDDEGLTLERSVHGIIPYETDLQYLQDQFTYLSLTKQASDLLKRMEVDSINPDVDVQERSEDDWLMSRRSNMKMSKENEIAKKESQLRQLQTKLSLIQNKIETRLTLTRHAGPWLPRLEKFVQTLKLDKFEVLVILELCKAVVKPTAYDTTGERPRYYESTAAVTVGLLLRHFAESLDDKISFRRYFYKSSKLIKEGIIIVTATPSHNHGSSSILQDLTDNSVELDRRMLDYIVGLDTEFSEIVDGSNLYTPNGIVRTSHPSMGNCSPLIV